MQMGHERLLLGSVDRERDVALRGHEEGELLASLATVTVTDDDLGRAVAQLALLERDGGFELGDDQVDAQVADRRGSTPFAR